MDVYVLVIEDPNSDEPFGLHGVYDEVPDAVLAAMEYFDDLEPHQSTDDPFTVLTNDPDVKGIVVPQPFISTAFVKE